MIVEVEWHYPGQSTQQVLGEALGIEWELRCDGFEDGGAHQLFSVGEHQLGPL